MLPTQFMARSGSGRGVFCLAGTEELSYELQRRCAETMELAVSRCREVEVGHIQQFNSTIQCLSFLQRRDDGARDAAVPRSIGWWRSGGDFG